MKDTAQIIDALITNITKRDAQAVGDMFSEDAVFEEMVGTGGVARGKQTITALWENFFKDLTKDSQDNRWDVQQKIIDGNSAAIVRTSHFKYKGRKVVIDMVAIIQLNEAGEITSYRDFCDSRIFIPQDDVAEWDAYQASIKDHRK